MAGNVPVVTGQAVQVLADATQLAFDQANRAKTAADGLPAQIAAGLAPVAAATTAAQKAASDAFQLSNLAGTVSTEGELAGKAAGQYRVGAQYVTWNGNAVTSRSDMLASAVGLDQVRRSQQVALADLRAGTLTVPAEITRVSDEYGQLDLVSASVLITDGGSIFNLPDGRQAVRALRLLGVSDSAWFTGLADQLDRTYAAGRQVKIQPGDYYRTATLTTPDDSVTTMHGATIRWASSGVTAGAEAMLVFTGQRSQMFGGHVHASRQGATNNTGISSNNDTVFTGVRATGAAGSGYNAYGVGNVRYVACRADGNGLGLYTAESDGVYVSAACDFSANKKEGILAQANTKNLNVQGSSFNASQTDSGISVAAGAVNTTLIGNVCNGNKYQGIECQGPLGGIILGNTCNGNDACGILLSTYFWGPIAIDLEVGPNTCHDNGQAGMQLGGASYVTVLGGSYCNNSRLAPGVHSGIQLVRVNRTAQDDPDPGNPDHVTGHVDCLEVLIEGSICTDKRDQADKTQAYGVAVSAGDHLRVRMRGVRGLDGNKLGAVNNNSTQAITGGNLYVGTDIRDCEGYNPHPVATPTLPNPYDRAYNTTGVPVTVSVYGNGAHLISTGTAGRPDAECVRAGMAGGNFDLLPGDFIALNYDPAAKPTWMWQGR